MNKKNRLTSQINSFLVIGLFLIMTVFNAMAQPPHEGVNDSLALKNDSAYILSLIDSLEMSRINEANARMELAQFKFQMASSDSIKREEQRRKIDSLRLQTIGSAVIIDQDTLFQFYSKRGGYSPAQRALMTQEIIEKLGRRFNLKPDSVFIDDSDNVSDIMYENTVIASFTDQDALWAGVSQDSLAKERRKIIVQELHKLKESHSFWLLLKRIFYLILIII